MNKDQEIVDKVMTLRSKLIDITNRIEFMEDIIDKTIEHNIGAKMRIQMDSFPIKQEVDRYTKRESEIYGDDENKDEEDSDGRKPGEAPSNTNIGGMLSGHGFAGLFNASNQLFKNTVPSGSHIAIQPIDITLDEPEVILMVGAILNLTRRRKEIIQKEYKKTVKLLKL